MAKARGRPSVAARSTSRWSVASRASPSSTPSPEIRRAKAEGKVGLILASQDGSILESDPNLVEIFYRIGFRVIQLTYNERNLLGDGCHEPANAGLSRLGVEMIQAMNRIGMVLDLSHVGERTSLEAIEVSSKPVLFSHSNPRARADSARNITDEQISEMRRLRRRHRGDALRADHLDGRVEAARSRRLRRSRRAHRRARRRRPRLLRQRLRSHPRRLSP